MSLVERIQTLCSSKSTTLIGLERQVGLGRGTIRKWDESSPSVDKLKKVADYFNVSTDYLLGREYKGTEVLNESTKDLPALSPKDERDIAKDLGRTLANLESNEALAFEGEPLTEEDRELLKISLENSMRLAKQLAKKKFTPKKYKK